MNKRFYLTALGAVIGIPLLMIGQQILLPREKQPAVPLPECRRDFDHPLMLATDRIMDARQPKAVYFASVRWLWHNDPVSAECWMRYGAAECRYPSIMLLYADFCRQRSRYTEARRWLRLAGYYGRSANAAGFCKVVEQRLKELPPEVKR